MDIHLLVDVVINSFYLSQNTTFSLEVNDALFQKV